MEEVWRAVAAAVLRHAPNLPRRAVRYRLRNVRMLKRRCDEALIRQDFACRFHAAMRETCALARQAAVARLILEQAAALCRVREDARAEEKAAARQEVLAPRTKRRRRRDRYRAKRNRIIVMTSKARIPKGSGPRQPTRHKYRMLDPKPCG
jgi:hypothetical protein